MISRYLRPGAAVHLALLVATALVASPLSAAPLPRLAVSLRTPADVALFRQSCGSLRDVLVFVPGGTISIDADPALIPDAAIGQQVATMLPSGTEAILQVQLGAGTGPAPDEAALDARLTATVAALPLAHMNGLLIQVAAPAGDARLLQFALATLVIKAKGANPKLSITLMFPPGVSTAFADFARRASVYVDAIAIADGPGWRDEAGWINASLHKATVLQERLDASLDGQAAARAYLDAIVDAGEVSIQALWIDAAATGSLGGVCRASGVLAGALPDAFATAPLTSVPLSIAVDQGAPAGVLTFLDSRSGDVSLLVRTGGTTERPRSVTVTGKAGKDFELTCADALDGRALPGSAAAKPAASATRGCGIPASHALVTVRWAAAAEGRVVEAVNVMGRAELRVEEIIARWQQAREAERRSFDNAMADCLVSLHFEPTGLGGGFDVALELHRFLDRAGADDWIQTGFFLNGVRLKGRHEFPLPQLEPEKVLTQPLDLRLDEKYAYSLDGIETVNGVPCYIVRFTPKEESATLYRGRMWIDGLHFRQVRAELEQRGGKSNVISHLEKQEFQVLADAQGREFNLLRSIYVQEILNAAGRSFLLEKTTAFSNYAVNSDKFAEALGKARASEDPMFRDTATGLRTLRRQGTERVVESANTRRIRSIIMGTFYDGSFGFPIPMAGYSFVDFDYRGTGNQLSVFFAGPIVAADLSRQKSGRFRLGVDAALSALPSNNRVFAGNTEVKSQEMWKFNETFGGLASWQATPSVSVTGSSYVTWSWFRATGDTDPTFVMPQRAFTFENSAEVKIVSHGYSFNAMVLRGDRAGWGNTMGPQNALQTVEGNYLKYSGEFLKQGYIGRFTKLGLEAAYFGGEHLDRFSRYQPSFLSRPRIRGIPSGTDTFDDVGVAGVSYGFNVAELVKFEGVYNHAWGRNRQESNRFRDFDGLEFDVGTAAPWNMFLQGTISYALRGNIDRYNTRWGVYVLLFKPLHQ